MQNFQQKKIQNWYHIILYAIIPLSVTLLILLIILLFQKILWTGLSMSEFIQLMIMISPYIILIINNKILQLREKKKLNQDIQVYFEKLKRAIKNIIEDTDQSIYYFNYLRQELPHYGKYFGYLTIYENNDKLRGYSFLEGKASIDLWIEKISISYLEEVETIEHQNIKMRDKFFDALKNYANKNYYLDLK